MRFTEKIASRAVFEISGNSGNSFKFPKEMGALVSIAGLGSSGNSSSRAKAFSARNWAKFILNFNNKYSLDRDPYFSLQSDYKTWATLK